jgi:hypothetical protein
MATAPNQPSHVVWAGFDTFLAIALVAAMILVVVHG